MTSASMSLSSDALTHGLDRAIELTGRFGEDFVIDYGQLQELRERLRVGRFHLAVLGQFKRGKSTLLNAILGESVLPTGVVPVTSIPTFISSGPQRRARVFAGGQRFLEESSSKSTEALSRFLARFVSEEQNPNNHVGVSRVELSHPAPILQSGVVLIDTPGVGSTFQHNTKAALDVLPECDAALFLISADPPLTDRELDFLREIRRRIPRLFFIMNKVDYLNDGERQAAVQFFKRVLHEHLGIDTDRLVIFCTSARLALAARQSGDSDSLAQSGLPDIENRLVSFLANEKAAALHEAVAAKTRDRLTAVLLQLE